jgi:Fe-S cluster assembly iron-binding protein IscA
MGYYSSVNIECSVKDIKKLKGLFAEIKLKIASGIAEDWEYELDILAVDEDGDIYLEDNYAKWYYDEKWILKLAPYLDDGEIEFIGEEGERWGYFIEDGKAYITNYEKTKGELLTE